MRMIAYLSVIIFVIHRIGILADKPECNAPVSAHGYGPCAFSIALERMKIQAWELHIFRYCGGAQLPQNKPQSLTMFCLDARRFCMKVPL